MSIILPEIEVIENSSKSLRYLEHGWPDPLCRWHAHKECELHLILETHGKAFVGDYIGDFGPRTLFLTGPSLPHNWITDDIDPTTVTRRDMVIQFDHKRLEQFFGAFPEFQDVNTLLDLSRSGLEFFDFDFEWVRARFSQVRDTTGPEQVLTFLELLTNVSKLQNRKTLSTLQLVQPEGNSRQARIGEVVDHIVNNFAEPITVEIASEIAGMSPTAFSRNFQAVKGNKFIEFVNRIRIGQACSMLYATEQQISAICYDVGFQNLANFNRQFIKMKEMTPSAYRDTARRELVPAPGARTGASQ